MDEIVTTVDNSWNAEDPSRPLGLNFVGSDDFLRAKFEVRSARRDGRRELMKGTGVHLFAVGVHQVYGLFGEGGERERPDLGDRCVAF